MISINLYVGTCVSKCIFFKYFESLQHQYSYNNSKTFEINAWLVVFEKSNCINWWHVVGKRVSMKQKCTNTFDQLHAVINWNIENLTRKRV